MPVDIQAECMKAGDLMRRYGVPGPVQTEVVKILMEAGVEHCLQEQQKIRERNAGLIERATNGLVH
jgi:hypothetical protein